MRCGQRSESARKLRTPVYCLNFITVNIRRLRPCIALPFFNHKPIVMKQVNLTRSLLRSCFAFWAVVLLCHNVNAQTQTITAMANRTEFGIGIGGFYESLPVDYSTNVNRKYPLLIALHGSGERGSGSTADLPDVLTTSSMMIPKLINTGNFPDSFTVNNETFSFIVICPQLRQAPVDGDSLIVSIKRLVEYCKSAYRVDPDRVYMTGLSFGSQMQWNFTSRADDLSGSTVTYRYADSLAAIVSVSTYLYPSGSYSAGSSNIARVATSNLPVFAKHNDNDPSSANKSFSISLVNNLNNKVPAPSPLAEYDLYFPGNSHDAWTAAYNPANIFDSATGYNMYEWMLQFRNRKLSVDAGRDTAITAPASSVTLNGSLSKARRGRISGYLWTKIAGPSSYSITSPSSATTTVTGLVGGTYQFELRVTHSDTSYKVRDTVSVTVTNNFLHLDTIPKTGTMPHGLYLSLPPDYSADTTKKYPLLIYLHGNPEKGDGSAEDLRKILTGRGGYTIPRLIDSGYFPASFEVKGKTHSFIVACPQYSPAFYSKTFIAYMRANYRIDETMIYITGVGEGGAKTWDNITNYSVSYTGADSIAATVLVYPSIVDDARVALGSTNINNVNSSNLPLWATYNSTNSSTGAKSRTDSIVTNINATSPTPAPLAKRIIYAPYTSDNQDCWSRSYHPSLIFDSSQGYNIYQWLLQFSNRVLVADAGTDTTIVLPTSTVTLRGSNSSARRGRIAAYLWTKITGPGSGTITSSTSATTTVTSLAQGTYTFELKVTHSNSAIARDTVTITVNSSSPRVAPPSVQPSLPTSEDAKQLQVRVSPTIAGSQVTIVITGEVKGQSHIGLYSLDGKRLQTQQFYKGPGAITRTMDVTTLPKGIYVIETFVGNKNRRIVKILKQ